MEPASARPRHLPPVTLPDRLADFGVRGFRLDRPAQRAELEGHARAFLRGFGIASRWRDVHGALAGVPAERRGFAYEGAGMFAGAVGALTAGRAGLFARLLDGPGDGYVHLLHVGHGWPPGPLRLGLPAPLPRTPLLRWLALDGAGFADVFFGGTAALRQIARRHTARGEPGPRAAARLAGAGRALWFAQSADVPGVAAEIDGLPAPARPDVWAGAGLAAAYAGCTDAGGLRLLADLAGSARPNLLQGVMFGVTARSRSGVVPGHTVVAAATLLHAGPADVEGWTDAAARGLERRRDAGAYGLWRSRLADRARDLPEAAPELAAPPEVAQ